MESDANCANEHEFAGSEDQAEWLTVLAMITTPLGKEI